MSVTAIRTRRAAIQAEYRRRRDSGLAIYPVPLGGETIDALVRWGMAARG